jgi:hypothetical protein
MVLYSGIELACSGVFLLSLVINGYVTFMVMLIPVLEWELFVFCLLMWSSYGFLHFDLFYIQKFIVDEIVCPPLYLLHWKVEAECGLLYTYVFCVWTVVSSLLTALHVLFYKASQSNDQSNALHVCYSPFNFICYFKLLVFFFSSCSGKHLGAFKKTNLLFRQCSRWMTESTELGCYLLQFNFIVASLNITM